MPTSNPNSSLRERVQDLGYTPKVRDLPELLSLAGEDDDKIARAGSRAVLRIDPQHLLRVVETVVEHASKAVRPARGRLARLVGELVVASGEGASSSVGRAFLVAALLDADPKTRRASARALGKIASAATLTKDERATIEDALIGAWKAKDDDDDRRAFAEALGKLGSKKAKGLLAAKDEQIPGAKKDLRTSRAKVMIERAEARENPGAIDSRKRAKTPISVRFRTRSGLETILADELEQGFEPRVVGPGIVDAELRGSLADALAIRTALEVTFPLAPRERSTDLAEDLANVLTSPEALDVFRTFTQTTTAIRFRLAFADGKRRAPLAWEIAERVRKKTSDLVNDPTASTWEVLARVDGPKVEVELAPRGFQDERFSYRTAVVPASSHPVVAAALARVAPRSPDDIVWDPFVGAGAELVERARLGPYKELHGTDLDAKAIEAARTNLHHAHITDAVLNEADALAYAPKGVTLIITNPPMGRRVQRGSHGDLLERFLAHAFVALSPGGALVWAAPEARKLHALAREQGFSIAKTVTMDMGGFPADLSIYRKPRSGARRIVPARSPGK